MQTTRRHLIPATLAVFVSLSLALAASACGSSSSKSSRTSGGRSTTTASTSPKLTGKITLALGGTDPKRCDVLDLKHCMLPFPNDFFTGHDTTTDTKLRVNFVRESMPANKDGVHVDPTEWNRNDGFSPGSQIRTYVAGLDLAKSGIAPITDIGSSLGPNAPIVVLNTKTHEPVPYFAELDSTITQPADRMLIIRPARNLSEGTRYVVALRNLKDANGSTIEAQPAFRAFRDRLDTGLPDVEARRDHMEQAFADLEQAGVDRKDLNLAWDFTVASRRNLSERILRMRDDAFKTLGPNAPKFTVTKVEENPTPQLLRKVTGTFDVPLYLSGDGGPGTHLENDSNGLPHQTGKTYPAPFVCIVPRAAVDAAGKTVAARPSVYGHGLLGTADEVDAANVGAMANEHDFVFCATDWLGMSEPDVPNAIKSLQDFSNFPTMPDRMQQGILDALFLGRLMIHEQGLVTNAAFKGPDGLPVVDRKNLFYDGNSQGGIMGGAATAVAQDWTRAVLGVPGMNYSILLNRSTDFATYKAIMDPAYPNEYDRTLALNLTQMLWDRGEADGYAAHLTDHPLPNTPKHTVLMHLAFGDFQVANVAAEVEARTAGVEIVEPALAAGRSPDKVPHWGIDKVPSLPFDGSALVSWDSGAPAPPLANVAPGPGHDPHSDPRSSPTARQQKSDFLRGGGSVTDVCGGKACTAAPVPNK
ncbi:MAG: hypothetical protein U0V73_15875 [Acidimicrobiia bacterium]